LLATFEADLSELALRPGAGGIFEVRLDGETIATNHDGGALPDAADVKRLLRDRIAPGRKIGHA
jgi:selenoprotein W-related protein